MIGTLSARFGVAPVLASVPITLGLMNQNWRWTTRSADYAVKRLRDATPATVRRQQRALPTLAAHGIPVAVPFGLTELDGHWYTIAPWLPGTHTPGTALSLPACHELGRVIGHTHSVLRAALPAGPSTLPPPPTVAETIAQLERLAAATGDTGFDDFARAEIDWRLRLLPSIAHLRPDPGAEDPIGWTHGDLTPLNLLFTGSEVSGILDWDRLGVRPYGREVIRTAAIVFVSSAGLDLDRIAAFSAGYRSRIAVPAVAMRDAAHRRWWDLATDTYFLRRHYDQGDTGCDHLFHSSSAVLRWWTGHRDDVAESLTSIR
ncbi:phosphotransferase [Actinoplanes derwentensis]|uniref:Homoserine kinase type II n=1 Tax=Actinoplanes derwentensis TaxID=113562 RepID=A0A1H1TV21_9ACTN|nr:phosphotransferase [Actinoplanes derwentensis]GID85144.1 hypothetical protein Ade03nite_40680 [Actinoplanes derwentensis]SDS64042.1 homoserine kinase type II [Actinoplanes derwentensis]